MLGLGPSGCRFESCLPDNFSAHSIVASAVGCLVPTDIGSNPIESGKKYKKNFTNLNRIEKVLLYLICRVL